MPGSVAIKLAEAQPARSICRLERDLLSTRPNVVAVMLGMNDGYYRPSQPRHRFELCGWLSPHCRHRFRQSFRSPRHSHSAPSPFDDITPRTRISRRLQRGPACLQRDAIGQLAKETRYGLTDFNAPVTTMLKTLNESAPNLARQLGRSRSHRAEAGRWDLAADSLLKHWNAPLR